MNSCVLTFPDRKTGPRRKNGPHRCVPLLKQSVFPVHHSEFPARAPFPKTERNPFHDRQGITDGHRSGESEIADEKTVFDNLNVYLFILTSDGNIIDCNHALGSRLGLSRRDILAGGLRTLIAPEHLSGFIQAMTRERPIDGARVDTVLRCGNGAAQPITVTLHPFRSGNGCLLLAEGIDRPEHADERRFHRQFHTAPLPALVWRKRDGGFVLANHNRAAECFWKAGFRACGGEKIADLFPANPEVTGMLDQCCRARKRIETEIECPQKDGAVQCRVRLAFDFSPPDFVFMYVEDVTEKRDMEERVRVCRNLLRSLSSELTLAEENQRTLIAADLHDCVNQSLAVAQFKLEELEEEIPSGREKVTAIRRIIENTIREARGLSFELSPPILRESGFDAAAEWLAERFGRERGISIRVRCDRKPERLPADVEILLFKALRELLHNTYKHARARSVCVSIWSDGENVYVQVEDDGTGFDPARTSGSETRTGGFGLFSIRERLQYLGGDMNIESALSKGTRCILRAPLEKRSQP